MVKKLLSVRILFAAAVTASFAYCVYEARTFAYLARIFPFYISLVLFFPALINLVQEIRKALKGAAEEKTGGTADLEARWDIRMSDVLIKFLLYVIVILILYGSIWLIGYPLSITIFIVAMYRYLSETKWMWALTAGLAGLGFLALVSRLLYMDWPEGVLKLPWPLG